MARVALTEPVLQATSPATFARNAEVFVYERGTTTKVNLYTAESGGSSITQPLITDEGGRPEGTGGKTPWIAPGSYDLKVNGQTIPWEAPDGSEAADLTALESSVSSKQDASTAATDSELATEKFRAETAEGLKLAKASNLSDVASAPTARTNLGLGTAATKDIGSAGEEGKVLGADDPFLLGRAPATETVNSIGNAGEAQTIDLSKGTVHRTTLNKASCALTFPAASAGKSFTLELVQDGTGGRLVTWPGSARFPNGVTPVLSTAKESVDVFYVACLDGEHWGVFPAGPAMQAGGKSEPVAPAVQTALNAKPDIIALPPQRVAFGSCQILSAKGAATYGFFPGRTTEALTLSTSAALGGDFWFDPTKYEIGGKTVKLRLHVVCMTPGTASTITHVCGLYPITGSEGATTELKNKVGEVIAASKVEFKNQAKETIAAAEAKFTPPTAGLYALADLTSGTNTTNCFTNLIATLEVFWE